MNVSEQRKHFPVLEKYTYLNTANSGLISDEAFEWRRQYDQAFLETGSKFRDHIIEDLESVKSAISRCFHCPQEQIALVQNFSVAMNFLVEGLPKNAKVLIDHEEYPSVTTPFETRGFEIHVEELNGLAAAELVQIIEREKIGILAISMTQWRTGRQISSETLATVKQEIPDLIVLVDGTQFLGTAPFDFSASNIDVFVASGYKWMLSGYGSGLAMFKEGFLEQYQPKCFGNNTIMTRLLGEKSYPAQIFEPGHLDYLAFGTMKIGLEFLEAFGFDRIQKQITSNMLHLKTQLVGMGFIPAKSLGGRFHSPILLIPGSQNLVTELANQDILVSFRDGIRISVHFYNTEADLNRLITALKLIV